MKFKLMLFIFCAALLFPAAAYAQNAPPEISAIDISTFMGIAAAVTMVVTQIAKQFPFFAKHKFVKILTALFAGIVLCFFSWFFGFAEFLKGALWWEVILQGAITGLTAIGLYDLLFKSVSPPT